MPCRWNGRLYQQAGALKRLKQKNLQHILREGVSDNGS